MQPIRVPVPRRHPVRLAAAALGMFLMLPVQAALTVSGWGGGGAAATDPFDVAAGAAVVSNSVLNPGSDIRSAVGYVNPAALNTEPDIAYFSDANGLGFVNTFVVKTLVPVTITGFELRTYDDSWAGVGNSNRGFSAVTLSGSSDGVNYTVLATGNLGNSYTAAYGQPGILVSGVFSPVSAQYFKFEGVQASAAGGRLYELDAVPFTTPVPEPHLYALFGAGLALLGLRMRRDVAKGKPSANR